MTILITGAAGFIGSSLCHWIINNTEHEVIAIDNLSGGFDENLLGISERLLFYMVDTTSSKKIDFTFKIFNPDIVFHMAAYASEGRANHIREFIHSNNTVGTSNIINACINHNCKLVFTSSVAVYSGRPPFDEDTEPNPIDEYGLSKWCSEKSIEIAGREQGLDWCIVRPRNVYGIRQSLWDRTRNLFGIWMYNALNGLPLAIFGDGTNRRSFTSINDIVEPLWNAHKISREIINLGSRKVYTINEAASIFSKATGCYNFVHTEPRIEVEEAFCSIEKSKHLLWFRDKTSLYDGLVEMWAWAKKTPKRELQIPPKLEVTKNAHLSVI